MYKEHFNLDKYPFENTPNPAFYFNSEAHREALASLVYGVRAGKGYVLITGEIGSGKTMLAQTMIGELGGDAVIVRPSSPWTSYEEILALLRRVLSLPVAPDSGLGMLDDIKTRLEEIAGEGHKVVMLVDEAHQLSVRTLEGIRLLSNLETPTDKLLQIVLLGQVELMEKLSDGSLRQLNQRIAMRSHLGNLQQPEVEGYMRHRVQVAGGQVFPFSPDAVYMIAEESAGSPRLINLICDSAMLVAYGKGLPLINAEIVREVVSMMTPLMPPQTSNQSAGMESAQPGQGQTGSLAGQSTVAPAPELMPLPEVLTRFSNRVTQAQPAALGVPTHRFAPPTFQPPPTNVVVEKQLSGKVKALFWLVGGGLLVGLLAAVAVWWWLNGGGSSLEAPRQQGAAGGNEVLMPAQVNVASSVVPMMPKANAITLTTNGDVRTLQSMVAGRYGAWNDTTLDLLMEANPELSSFHGLPPGTNVRLYLLQRESMVVENPGNGFSIYYGAFGDQQSANGALAELSALWKNARLYKAKRKDGSVYRLYLDGYESRNSALDVAHSNWTRYLPNLN